jgi:hypothetical protein
MRFATPSVEVQEKVGGVWRTVWANGIPVKDNRKTDLPPYVHPGPAGARMPYLYSMGIDITGKPFKVTLY